MAAGPAWLLAGLAALLAVAALAGRNEIAARLPATVPFYQLLGLPLELPLGMEFREPRARCSGWMRASRCWW